MAKSQVTIFTNGCFDILHPGHIRLFRYAKSLGDRLIVGVDRDEKVIKDKGPGRPINPFEYRIEMLGAIKYIDEICSFNDTQGLDNLMRIVSPDILVIGSDWRSKTVVGEEYVKEVQFFERIDKYSTTKTIQDILNR